MKFAFVCGLVVLSLLTAPLQAAREYGGRYPKEKIDNARANCEKFDWAKKVRDDAISAAKFWVEKSDDELWEMIPGQDLPRCIDVTLDRSGKGPAKRVGCLKCGEDIFKFGNYPYDPDFENKRWKLTCPSCKSVFPTNDFGKYYASGMNEHGVFDPKKADRSLLFNTEHPDPKDPLHKFGVDDGFGFIDDGGHAHRFIGYYTWKYWRRLYTGVTSLSSAYLYTGDKQYAHKAAILLDRIADVYPSMDWRPYAKMGWFHSDGGRIAGKIEGAIWETQTATHFADSYDKILSGTMDDPQLCEFLKNKAEKYSLSPKGTRELLLKNIDDNVLRVIHDSILDEQISGNEGMQQQTMAVAALALNTQPETNEWLDWLFKPDGGAIPGLLMNHLDRDGASDEAAPGYAYFFGQLVGTVASLVADYPQYKNHNVFEEFPQFRTTYTIAYRMAALGYATPNKGDSGATGLISAVSVNPNFIAEGYRRTRDPKLAIAAYHANGDKMDGLARDIFSADPDALAKEIEVIARTEGARQIKSDLMTGFGVAMLQSGDKNNGAALPISYGKTTHHSHLDHLNFDLLAFGNWLLPDHGYPEYGTSWPSRDEWTMNTISHNTVVVDQKPQKRVWSGHTRLYKCVPGLSVVTIEGRDAYPQTKKYERTMLLIDAPGENHYAIDLFKVEGGNDHVYSIHGPPGESKIENLNLSPQQGGSYAGADIAPETSPGNFPLGYSYLFNVRRDQSPAKQFLIDFKAQAGYRGVKENDDIHVRFHSLSACDDVALADGKPPQTKAGNPKTLPYALLHRAGENVTSTFVSVFEPYKDHPFIASIERQGDSGIELKVNFVDGSNDVITFDDPNEPWRVSFVRRTDARISKAILIAGTSLETGSIHLTQKPALKGRVVKMNRGLEGGGWMTVDADLPTDGSLVGEYIIVGNDNDRDACYQITEVQKAPDGTRVVCGPISFVRGYKGETIEIRSQIVPKDYTQGFLYDFEEGAEFRIAMHPIATP